MDTFAGIGAVTGGEALKRIGDFMDNGKFIGRAAACITVFRGDTPSIILKNEF